MARLPGGVKALGMVSLLMDTSSELIHSLLPVFMATTLGAGMVTIGMVEGIAEATASATRVASGLASDRIRRRKTLLLAGYGLAALSKPMVPLATSILWVAGARFVDRMGKGIRGAPRDALIADITPSALRGAAYGLRQGLDSFGAVLGPLLAITLMAWFDDNLRAVLWVAVVPAVLAVGWLAAGVREPAERPHGQGRQRMRLSDLRCLDRRYWAVVVLCATITLARFSEAFLVLRAENVGLQVGYVPVVMIVMNVAYAAAAYPGGLAADRFRSRGILLAGMGVLAAADLILALAGSATEVLLGAFCWGLHLALTQGLLSKLIADTAPRALRGTAFGISSLVNAAALLMASLLAGALWESLGPAATFTSGGVIALAAATGVLALRRTPATE
jgi:MFS family permease